jgi:phage recombination protein Bet
MTTTALESSKLPEPVARRGVSEAQWRTLCHSLYPGANPKSVLLVLDYCRARNLDPLKRPCHIVPIEVRDPVTGAYVTRDVVLPGIYELRTTSQRTGVYLGHSRPDYGPIGPVFGVEAPAWCELTFYRWNETAGQRVEFPVRTYFREVCATVKDRKTSELTANARWRRAPVQMLTKCCEAAGLREAFPDEFGGMQTAEELDGQRAVDAQAEDEAPPAPAPAGFEAWWDDLRATAEERDLAKLEQAYAASAPALRAYVAQSQAYRLGWEALKREAQRTTDGDVVEGETE